MPWFGTSFQRKGRTDIPVLKIGTPYPFPERLADAFISACDVVLVLEETDTVIEYFLRDKTKVLGRLSGHVPLQGELVPQVIHQIINTVLTAHGLDPLGQEASPEALALVGSLDLPVRKPRLCAGMRSPGRLLFHQKDRTQGHFHFRHRLLHPGAQSGSGGYLP